MTVNDGDAEQVLKALADDAFQGSEELRLLCCNINHSLCRHVCNMPQYTFHRSSDNDSLVTSTSTQPPIQWVLGALSRG
jgi:hypothetical protein